MRRIALLIKEGPQGVLETLKTHEQLSHHRGVFAQIHLTSGLRMAGLTRKGRFYINAVHLSNRPSPLKLRNLPTCRKASREVGFVQNSLVENRKLFWRLSPIAEG